MLEIVCVGNDMTERRRAEKDRAHLERQLQQTQRMEALGTLAGGIAHDFNNILAAIMGYTEMALFEVVQGSKIEEHLQQVLKSSHLARELVKQILLFSRRSEHELKPFQLCVVVKETMKLIRASLPTTIQIRQRIDTSGLILGDPSQIYQIVMNLCTNAEYAMRERGGILEVTLDEIRMDNEKLSAHLDLSPGNYLELTVADTGLGIDPAIMESIFDPFFTTKAAGEGTGLGLSVVHGIVKKHHGAINAYSEPGRGTVFKIFLPVLETIITTEEVALQPIPRGTERILLIDDEPALTSVGRQMLESLGYEVVSRNDSSDALLTFETQPQDRRFDLVITDLTMPRMTGVELARRLLKRQPDLPIVLCTGFSEVMTPEVVGQIGVRALINKPVATRELGVTVRKVLDESREVTNEKG
jgi:nitrogen-specific signal transduction histidine kinase/CheY-like chemotaxis protein